MYARVPSWVTVGVGRIVYRDSFRIERRIPLDTFEYNGIWIILCKVSAYFFLKNSIKMLIKYLGVEAPCAQRYVTCV